MGSHEIQLTYFAIRARGEPVLLLLADSGIPFILDEVSAETWSQWRTSGKVTHDLYPYSAMPVLRVRDKSAGGNEFVLAETSAILTFLEEFLAPQGASLLSDMSLEVRVSAQMIKEASLFFLGQVWQTSVDKDWLAPPKREKLWRGRVTRYLRNTEGALHKLNMSTNVVPHATEPLKGYTVAVVTAINFITDVFPSAKAQLRKGGEYELCGKVWATVNERERIVEYWRRNGVQRKPWTITAYGTANWIESSKL